MMKSSIRLLCIGMLFSMTQTACSKKDCAGTISETISGIGNDFTIALGNKGAQSFQTTKDGKINNIMVYFTAPTATSVVVKLYSNASNPEAGTLLGTSTVSSGFNTSSPTQINFGITPAAITAGTLYFIVIEPLGGYIKLDVSNGSNPALITGNFWFDNVSTWTSQTTTDMSFGLGGTTSTCN